MKKNKKIISLVLAVFMLVAILTVSVSAGNDSVSFTNGSGSLTATSTYASASTNNALGYYYTYAKATLDYTNGDWDINWNDGLGSASAYVSRYPGFTVSFGSGTHSVRNSQNANGGSSWVGYTRANP
jgi:hypothetical protein